MTEFLTPAYSLEAEMSVLGAMFLSERAAKEVCDLLHIPAAVSMNTEELLFQHVQFKTGQRVHTIGQAFDTL